MSTDTPSSDVITSPSPEEAENMVRRMSISGPGLTDPKTGQPLPKDDKVLKIATFSLQKYLKAS
jgi:engulfment/cell motility protein 1